MASPRLTPAQTNQLVSAVVYFIEEQRRAHEQLAQPLGAMDREQVAMHFPAEILDAARFARVRTLKNPPFYGELERMGFTNLPQFRRMAAISFVDVVGRAAGIHPSSDVSRACPCSSISGTRGEEIFRAVRSWISRHWRISFDTTGACRLSPRGAIPYASGPAD